MKLLMKMSLDKLPINNIGYIDSVNCSNNIKKRLLDLGLVKNTAIKPLFTSISNNPIAYLIRGSVIALRLEDSKNIHIYLK